MTARARPSIALMCVMSAMLVTAIGGAFGADGLAAHWLADAGVTVQVPRPGLTGKDGQTRRDLVLAALRGAKGVAAARALTEGEIADLLRPWLGPAGESVSLPLPAVITVQLANPPGDLSVIARELADIAPGTVLDAPARWQNPMRVAAERIRRAAMVVAIAVAGLTAWLIAAAAARQRHDEAGLLHALGASDGFIFARVAPGGFWRATLAGAVGAGAASLLLTGLHGLLAPVIGVALWPDLSVGWAELVRPGRPAVLDWPPALWAGIAAVPIATAFLDRVVARASLRRWLRRLG